mmetsp:Transcript_73114/g.117901  ORF Transcript_73114/g.117901 Transcript_73114/m.117901 type:complete len:373 (-) Transcript_73114:37-1155(-)
MSQSQQAEEPPRIFGLPIKYVVLCFLVVQNGGAVLLMRAVRALPGESEFATQTAVILQELLKGCTCAVLMLRQHGSLKPAFENRAESLKTAVPALLYLVQNNLQYVAVGYLDAPTYAVTYQTKIFWVAVCSVVLLGKKVERYQWFALFILMAGVCMVQFNRAKAASGSDDTAAQSGARLFGVCIILLAALCSSLAAVSFEKLLKGVKVDLWTRNLQLAFYSLICSIGPLLGEMGPLSEKGFFHGYTKLTFLCIAMNGWGGLLIGVVINYADAILKDIAIGASICLSVLGSVFLFEFQLTAQMILGIVMVSWAVPLYAGRASCGLALVPATSQPPRAALPGQSIGKQYESQDEQELEEQSSMLEGEKASAKSG